MEFNKSKHANEGLTVTVCHTRFSNEPSVFVSQVLLAFRAIVDIMVGRQRGHGQVDHTRTHRARALPDQAFRSLQVPWHGPVGQVLWHVGDVQSDAAAAELRPHPGHSPRYGSTAGRRAGFDPTLFSIWGGGGVRGESRHCTP